MGSPFLLAFSDAVITALLQRKQLELNTDDPRALIREVAEALSGAKQGSSLISTLSKALISSPDVEELWADDETLKELITDLDAKQLPR